jgi:hypothetical protein
MKLHIMQFAAFSCYFVPLRSKYSAHCPVLRHSDTLTASITAFKTRRCSDNIELTLVPVPFSCLDHFCPKFTDQDHSYFQLINLLCAKMFYSFCCKSSKFLYSHGSFLAFMLKSHPLCGQCAFFMPRT